MVMRFSKPSAHAFLIFCCYEFVVLFAERRRQATCKSRLSSVIENEFVESPIHDEKRCYSLISWLIVVGRNALRE